MEHTEKITFRASKQLKDELEKYARLQGISTGQLIRNWINVFLKNQVSNSNKHFYQLQDGREFPDMKMLCQELEISSRTARTRVKNGLIKKMTINPTQTQKYGNEIPTTRSRETERNRI